MKIYFIWWVSTVLSPHTAIDCGQLMPPVNGLVDTTGGTVFEREAVYSCREGYEVNGPTTRQCLASGQWNGMEPTCSCEYGVVRRVDFVLCKDSQYLMTSCTPPSHSDRDST